MRIAVIDYGSGNLRSVARAFEHVVGACGVVQVSAEAETLRKASHIVLPGVGAYADCMRGLEAVPGMLDALQEEVLSRKKNFLGICVGMQMLFERGHEHGIHRGLGWLKGEVVRLSPVAGTAEGDIPNNENIIYKIPHMGWNELQVMQAHPLLDGIKTGAHAYFVHSYHAMCRNPSDSLATVAYGQSITAVVGQGHIMGTQFHPEKSQETGLRLLKNFIRL